MDKHNWLVLANAAHARVLQQDDRGGYDHVADLVHPASRQKGTQLADDRPGRAEGTGHGRGASTYVPDADPQERERDRFARELARLLDEGVAAGRCDGILLVASSDFLGRVKAHLDEPTTRRLLRTVPHDYTALSDAEAARRLQVVPPIG